MIYVDLTSNPPSPLDDLRRIWMPPYANCLITRFFPILSCKVLRAPCSELEKNLQFKANKTIGLDLSNINDGKISFRSDHNKYYNVIIMLCVRYHPLAFIIIKALMCTRSKAQRLIWYSVIANAYAIMHNGRETSTCV